MMFNGASNELGHGIGAILTSLEGKLFPFTMKLKFDCTHNIAEYEACSMGIQAALDMKVNELQVSGDSMLVIHKLREEWETRDVKLFPYKKLIVELSEKFDKITFDYLPRENNQIADALAMLGVLFNLDLNQDVQPLNIGKKDAPTMCRTIEEEPDGKSWYYDIKKYIKYREFLKK
ncbi:uncharacterized protein LOC120080994 [Benincasa hispida]|uniref:uncharacterized protein LOC120080994 n=1 Tax=Benincasa hispida TaxID=102211 RepID=UPI0018FF1EDC|nr:uncharacterized protein LOC120080994 [Benincasa hispida]